MWYITSLEYWAEFTVDTESKNLQFSNSIRCHRRDACERGEGVLREQGGDFSIVNGYRLDVRRGVLERDGRPVTIRPKTFTLLCYLARNPGRVVDKEELAQAVWGGRAITDDALTQTIKDIRRVIEDRGGHFLRTVPRRGYMLLASGQKPDADQSVDGTCRYAFDVLVEESRSPIPLTGDESGNAASFAGAVETRSARLSGRDRPAIAVLPFAFDEKASRPMRLLRDGLLRDIVRDLSRLRTLFVIAANSLQALPLSTLGVLDSARLLRCDYVCAGTMAVEGPELRLDIELIAADGGHVLFFDAFRRPLASISNIGQALAGEIAIELADEIDLAERNIAIRRPLHALDAWQAYHRGLWHMHRFTGPDNAIAGNFFTQAIGRDPGFARPYASLAYAHFLKAFLHDPSCPPQDVRLAYELAARAVAVDIHDPAGHCTLGQALWLSGRHDEAIEALERTTALSPSYAFGHFSRAIVEALSRDPNAGIEASDRARELSPFDPFLAAMQCVRSLALLRLGRVEEAAAWGLRAARHPQADVHVMRIAVWSLTAAGLFEEAKPLVQRINRESPGDSNELFIRVSRMPRHDEKLLRDLTRQSGLL